MRRIGFYICLAILLLSVGMIVWYILDGFKAEAIKKKAQAIYYAPEAGSVSNKSADMPAGTAAFSNAPVGSALPANTRTAETSTSQRIQDKFLELLKINEDVAGWIKIPDTAIDYPVVQAKDNNYYLDHDIAGEKNKSGAIFMDYRNDPRGKNKNIVLYGHNMKNGSMFKDLGKYTQRYFLENHRVISFDTLYKNERWEVFSVYITDIYFDYIQTKFDTNLEYLEFLDRIKTKSLYKTDIKLGESDTILTLSTCTYEFDDARLVVQARLLK